ncbi:MAG TPA: hypothetical protein VEZ89_00940 [Rubrivivax sp.]|nr:hypothetical protein [Rubrivivax sp.]
MNLTLVVCGLVGVLLVLLAGFGLSRAMPTPQAKVQHGPFEIGATGRPIPSGGFPNTSGNPFATREVTSFSVRWRGQDVDVPRWALASGACCGWRMRRGLRCWS